MYAASLMIGGRSVERTTSGSVGVVNPATEEVLGSAPLAGAEEVQAALHAAQAAFEVWRRTAPIERAAKLRQIGELLRERVTAIATLLTLEIGKPLAESRGEIIAAAEYFEWCGEEARRDGGSVRMGRTPGSTLAVTYEPVGIVLALTAWNYPIILAARKLAMALAAGCSVILRPAEEAPACVTALVQCCQDAELPPGVVNLLFGSPQAVIEPLMAAASIRKVSFTGSTRVGQMLTRQSAETVKRITMELGGHAPFIVLEDADIELAANAAAFGKFRNAGQVCTAPSRFFVHQSVEKSFTDRLVQLAQSLKVGNGLEAGVQMGPLATERQRARAVRLVSDARAKGGNVACGGEPSPNHVKGYFFQPTVLNHLPDDAAILAEEPFVPVAAVVPFASVDAALDRANASEFALAAYVFTRSAEMAERFSADLQAGVVGINTATAALAEAPFGGIKQSGSGREGGEHCLREYQNVKFTHRIKG